MVATKITICIFHSAQVYIDLNGDAEGNYSVVAVVDEFSETGVSRLSMQPIAFFQYSGNSTYGLPVSCLKTKEILSRIKMKIQS